ncbi:E3 ubiquitin-protein ligase hel2 [Wickerhamiella sorbophila]|uniref:E3 ubiquitin-protein ligase hel2 n=1 Tax=Wickerhamiella sorbophila TaxID=45607 RepID=A0A2T0FIV1_9ASCO|nr:E3 ubiquitin-protein ligase hel2 [Wickerhamiella sorbophila]PRT54931.1 E3 ubiquitin-protein ligase hel2 [Wickerhamiella sorbophila]
MRWLMNDNTCPFCRSLADEVHITRNPENIKHEASLALKKLGMFCQDDAMKKQLEHLMRYPCPRCDKELLTLKALKEHVSSTHRSNFCMVCARNASQFSDEYALFNASELNRHMNSRHRRCEFCKWTFYSPDDLANHCRKEHESCFICDKRDPTRPQYFANYEKLEEHFQKEHYACMVPECINDKFVVFADRVELQAHMASEHPALIGKYFRGVNLAEMAASAPKGGAKPSEQESKELAQRRYSERLKIYANHDQEKIQKILDANSTFENKNVPTAAFISSYNNVLDVPDDQITVLLKEFSKITVANNKKTQELSNALAHRMGAASAAAATGQEPAQPGPSSRPGSSSTPKPPVLGGWTNSRVTGAINVKELPRLGERKRADYLSKPSTVVKPQIPGSSLPRLGAKPKKSATGLIGGGGPQTRLPALGSRSDRILLNEQLRSGSVSPAPTSSSAASSPSISRSSTPRGSGVDLTSLPRLPGAKKSEGKKGPTKVLRIV